MVDHERLKRGEIWLADLESRRGTEPGKTRPVLIVQAQALLDVGHPSTLVVPLTSRLIDGAAPLRLRVARAVDLAGGDLRRDSDLLIDQLRAIDNRRLVRRLATTTRRLLARVEAAIKDVVDLR